LKSTRTERKPSLLSNMESTVANFLDIPLGRLIKKRDAEMLLAQFAALLPAGELALVDGRGRFFAGEGEWSQEELQALLPGGVVGTTIESPGLWLQALLVNDQLAGALVFRHDPSDNHRLAAGAFPCLHTTFALLLEQGAAIREVVGETLDRYREINLLYRIGETVGASLETNRIPHLILDEIRPVVKADAGIVLLPNGSDASVLDDLQVRAGFSAGGPSELLHSRGRELVSRVCASGRSEIASPEPPAHNQEEANSLGTILCAPLKTQGQVLGFLLLGRMDGQPEFTAGDEKLVMALTGQAAIALETARLHEEEIKRQRLEEELAIGHQIQLSLLPKYFPEIPGWEIAAVYRSARQVGGDLYDIFVSPDEPYRLRMVIADVTGKGVPAALFMASSRTAIRTQSSNGRGPAATLRQANRFITRDIHSRLFLSAFYATLDTRDGSLVYANAGHDWPLLLRGDSGDIEQLKASGFVLGAFPDIDLEEGTVEISPGDKVVFYTDGITEARNSEDLLFGEERLSELLAENTGSNAQQLLDLIVESVERFIGDTPRSDDITLFVVGRVR
jgi:serine phosphatase RsbU (regulator of sigma subunit)